MYHKHQEPCEVRCKPFEIEAVVVCRDYSDFLAHTLPFNKQLFNRIVVVTSQDDIDTQKLCEFNHVQCIKTKALDLPEFNKGEAINVGLRAIEGRDWVVHLDADIYLPPQARGLLNRMDLDKRMLYGIDRFSVQGATAWHNFIQKPKLQHECGAYVHLNNAFPVGTRVITGEDGYIPIGFFQMWNPIVSGVASYPEGHGSAGRTDMQFAKLWPRSERGFIPEIVGYHLESERNAPMGANWGGRKTAPFVIPERRTLWQTLTSPFKKR